VRPYAQDPVMLHELLHAFHARLMPNGFENRGIKQFYNQALAKQVYDKDAYALKNHREFFAVTASIFLAGNDAVHEPKTRAMLKEKQPDYFKYLVGLFGFDLGCVKPHAGRVGKLTCRVGALSRVSSKGGRSSGVRPMKPF